MVIRIIKITLSCSCWCVVCLVASVCSHGDVRLVGGYTDYEGRVEVCISGYWGHVCSNGFYTSIALVVCKQLFGENISKMNYYCSLQGLCHLIYLVVTMEKSCCMASAVLGHHQGY